GDRRAGGTASDSVPGARRRVLRRPGGWRASRGGAGSTGDPRGTPPRARLAIVLVVGGVPGAHAASAVQVAASGRFGGRNRVPTGAGDLSAGSHPGLIEHLPQHEIRV